MDKHKAPLQRRIVPKVHPKAEHNPVSNPPSQTPQKQNNMVSLQGLVGNKAMQRMIQSQTGQIAHILGIPAPSIQRDMAKQGRQDTIQRNAITGYNPQEAKAITRLFTELRRVMGGFTYFGESDLEMSLVVKKINDAKDVVSKLEEYQTTGLGYFCASIRKFFDKLEELNTIGSAEIADYKKAQKKADDYQARQNIRGERWRNFVGNNKKFVSTIFGKAGTRRNRWLKGKIEQHTLDRETEHTYPQHQRYADKVNEAQQKKNIALTLMLNHVQPFYEQMNKAYELLRNNFTQRANAYTTDDPQLLELNEEIKKSIFITSEDIIGARTPLSLPTLVTGIVVARSRS